MTRDRSHSPTGVACALVLLAIGSARADTLPLSYPQPAAAPPGMLVVDRPVGSSYTTAGYPVGSGLTGPAPGAGAIDGTAGADPLPARVHGYLTTGIASHGGNTIQGAVAVPLVPGKADLVVGGGSGQDGVVVGTPGGHRTALVKYNDYYAALHVQPVPDVDVTVSVAGGHVRLPGSN